MELITGQRDMNADSLLRYFDPIYKWLQKENKNSGEYIGWDVPEKSECK